MWKECTLGDVITLQRGFDLPKQNRLQGSIPIVSSSGITDYHAEFKVKAPGVVTGRYGTIGQVFYIDEDFWALNTTLYVKDFKGNHPLFVYFLLKTIDFNSCSDKSSVPGVNRNDLHLIKVNLPPLTEQKAIARILGTLDDKIELNQKMNQTLEAMAQAVFKSWFVDFDPVRAKMAGQQPVGMDEATAALFPDSIEDSELGEIPRGWTVSKIGSECEFAYGKPLIKKNRIPGNIPVYGSNGQIDWHNEAIVKGAGIVIGRKGNPGIVTWVAGDFYPIDTTFYLVKKNESLGLNYLFYTLSNLNLSTLDTDSAVPGLNRNFAYTSQILIPEVKILDIFEKSVIHLKKKIALNELESGTLSTLRDTLLPKLMSGELRVPEADRQIAELV